MAITTSEYIAELEVDIRRNRTFLEPFEAGRAHVRWREGNREWREDTQEIIAETRRTIGILEKVVAALKEGKLK